MPIRFRARELFQPAANTAEEFTVALRDGVASFACSLWSSFPDFVTQGTNPANGFARGFMNSVCSPIQPPVPAPTVPFTGGQCCDTQYRVDITYTFIRCFNGNIEASGTPNFTITGKILGMQFREDPMIPGQWYLEIVSEDCQGNQQLDLAFSTTRCIRFDPCFTTDNTSPDFQCIDLSASSWSITSVVRTGGAPDVCGDPPPSYQSPGPSSNDLNTTINVNINDGLNLSVELQYIKLSDQYNFPMNFKVNGTNVTLDFDGLIFFAPDGFGSPSGGNDVPPPGSDSGDDGTGNTITKTYPDIEYPVGPDAPIPREVVTAIEYLVCTDGVIESIQTSLKLAVGFEPIISLIIDILGQILTDLCETPEASLGLPEYYGLSPGVDRPAIVYLWKILENGRWQASTYSSTVHHPTSQAIADIDTLGNIEKTIGTFKTFMRLTDGSVLKATGGTQAQSQANFDFLLAYTSSAFVPADINAATIRQEDTRLQVKTLTLRQIEYYPDGKKDNVEPTIKRVINP